ncbi:hypothetical protein PEDI_56110 [Persicobacter diffluens]|uniref:Uncharacterized protein n=1 Tax=Persicobacter diffluens TaxID=981 RepID=A0AAN4W569_9BACT|nr:hypothetical protein PEDI_56110 [Persicobacter diffluens]
MNRTGVRKSIDKEKPNSYRYWAPKLNLLMTPENALGL